ncbi:MAG: LysR family transcriptional regulator [Candidatus Latescibacterota bacterium]|jgi:DNA-binding transcriptional LysR family regulator
MDLYQLRGFYEIARERSFTRAAEKLFLTQPAISLQIKALESELGERLLDRNRRNICLTMAGEVLFGHVQHIFAHLESAKNEMAALREELRGRLVIGTSDTNCTYILPSVLSQYRQSYPGVELDIRNRMSPEVANLVAADEVDLGLATLPVKHRDLVEEFLFERREVLICRPDHALGKRKNISLDKVVEYPLLALERGSTSRQLLDGAFAERDLHPQFSMELGGVEVMKRFVEIGLGVALVPQVAVEVEVERGTIHALSVRGLKTRQVGLVEHRGRKRSPAATAFVEILQAQLAHKKV